MRLAYEMAQMKSALESTLEFERRQAGDFKAEARRWIEKLEGDVASLQAQVALEVEERRTLGQEVEQLRLHKEAFDQLPTLVRRLLVKKIVNARS